MKRKARRRIIKRIEGHRDCFAVLKIVVPKSLTDDERALWQRLKDASDFRPRA